MGSVVIVGAGPAGAALAFVLARRGVEVTLLERQTDFDREFRGEGLMPSGIEALHQMGLGGRLETLPQSSVRQVSLYVGHRRMLQLELTPETAGAFGPRFVSQPDMLRMIVEEASRFPSFRFETGVTVRDLVRDDGRITGVRGDSHGGPLEARGDFVIGTDGRASALRRRAGLQETRVPQVFDIVWCKLPLPPFLADEARAYLGPGHLALLFPAPDGRLQLAWLIQKGTFGELRSRGVEEWIDEMAGYVSEDLAEHVRASRNSITHPFLLDVICDRLVRWTAPGLLLLGDAAHPMSPVGAQGINIALRDALVAANHLLPVLVASGSAEALDAAAARTVAERLPEVSAIQKLQQRPPQVIFGTAWWSRFLLAGPIPFLLKIGVAPFFLRTTFQRFARGVTEVKLEV